MSVKDETPIQPEITMVDIMEEIKDLAEIIDIVHSELSDIKAILVKKDKPKDAETPSSDAKNKNGYMHG